MIRSVIAVLVVILLSGCGVRWVLLDVADDIYPKPTKSNANVGLDFSGVETVEVAEREGRTYRLPMQAQVLEQAIRSRYRRTGIGFEVIGSEGLPSSVRYRLVVSGRLRVVAFACAAEFDVELLSDGRSINKLTIDDTVAFGVASEVPVACEELVKQVVTQLDVFVPFVVE